MRVLPPPIFTADLDSDPSPDCQEVAFKAGYHCRWNREQGSYCFDPTMSPGDPDGAYAAWLVHIKKGVSDV